MIELRFPVDCFDCGSTLVKDVENSKEGVIFWLCPKCDKQKIKKEEPDDYVSDRTIARIEQFKIDTIAVENRKDESWRKGPKISRHDILTKSGTVEPGDPIHKGAAPTLASNPPATVLTFGKHKGKTYKEVFEKDKQYFWWACENIRGFQAKAKAECIEYLNSLQS